MNNQWIKNVLLITSGIVAVNIIKTVRDRKMKKDTDNEFDYIIEAEDIIIDEDQFA